MNPERAVKVWKPLYLHFTKDFDVFKDRCRYTKQEMDRNSKKLCLFSKCFEKEIDASFFLISNYVNNDFNTPFTIDKTNFEVYTDWIKRRESLSYIFEKEFNYFKEHYTDSELDVKLPSDSKLLHAFLSKKISPETMVLIDLYYKPFIDKWSTKSDINIAEQRFFILKKYRSFVKHDKTKILKIIQDNI